MTGRARIGIAAAVALLLTSSGLLRLLHSGSWVWPIVLAVIVSTAAGELFRRLIRSRPLAVAAQTLAVFWYDMVLLAHDQAFAGVLPTWAVFHRLGDLYSTGAHDIRDTFVGGDPTPGIAAILVLSLSALAVLVDALAATYAAAPLAGLPLLALYLVPATRSGGGYDWLAERLFPRVAARRLMLEYDDERSGDFAPLRHLREDQTAVLGLVTTKSGRRETVDELAGRIAEAAREVPLERLALSSQCGFATSLLGNELTPDDQQAKLEAIAATAERVWGEAAVRA